MGAAFVVPMQPVSWIAALFLVGCGGAKPIVAGDALPSQCRTSPVRLVRTFELAAPVRQLVRSGDGFLGLAWSDGDRTTELVELDGDGAVVSRRSLSAPSGCDDFLGFDTNGTDAFLAQSCETVPRLFRAGQSAWEPYADLPPPVLGLALDGSTIWWRVPGGAFSAPLPAAAGTIDARAPRMLVVPNGSNFDVVAGRQFSAEYAFEVGLRNGISIGRESGGVLCLYDTELVAGFTGVRFAQVVAGDPSVWIFATPRVMAELRIDE